MRKFILIIICGFLVTIESYGFVNGDNFTPGEFAGYVNGYSNVREYTNDYTRTAVENYKGHEGATYIKWTKLGAKPYGRAWAVKFDMTKGFQLCAATSGKLNSPRATVTTMANYLKNSRGKDPICGINCDYFTYDKYGPYTYTISDSRVLTAGQDKGGYYSTLIIETGDHKVKIGEVGRTDGKGAMLPIAHSFDVVDKANSKLKVRNSVRVNLYHYTAKDGAVYRPIDPAKGGYGSDYPLSLVGTGKDPATGHDIVVLFEADGRDQNWSYGVLSDVASQMLFDEGCTEVGEFDGGGSASIWIKDTASECGRDDGLVNKSTDGTARQVGNAIFIVAPETREEVVTINDINTYYDLDEVLLAVNVGEPIKVLKEVNCAGACVFERSCSVSSTKADPAEAKIVCVSNPSIASGAQVAFSNVVFQAPYNQLNVAAGAKAGLAGKVGLSVNMADESGIVLNGVLTDDVTINRMPGQKFGTSPMASTALTSSLTHLKNASNPNVAVVVEDDGNGGSILFWEPDAIFASITESDGFNYTNRLFSVEVTAIGQHVVANTRKVRLSVLDAAGAKVITMYKPLTATGTYAFDTADSGVILPARATYTYEFTVVAADGSELEGAPVMTSGFKNGVISNWFAASPASVVGGAWNVTPTVEAGAYKINDFDSSSVFTATTKRNDGYIKICSEVTFADGFPEENLAATLTSFGAAIPQSLLTIVEKSDDSLAWYVLAKVGSTPAWVSLYGVTPEIGVRYRCLQEIDHTSSVTKVRYSVAKGDGDYVCLVDANGNSWLTSPVTANLACKAEYFGSSVLHSIDGKWLTAALISVDGVDYEDSDAAFAAARAANKPIVLLTNLMFIPDGLESGDYALTAGGWQIRWTKGKDRRASLNDGGDLITIRDMLKGIILLFN